jgi:NitT/TauT family transport system permease protein
MKQKILYITYILIFFVTWHVIGRNDTANFFISRPNDTAIYISENYDHLLLSFFITAGEAMAGLIIAIALSYLSAVTCLFFPLVMRPLKSLFVITQVLPIITLAPLFIALFGMGMLSKIAMVSLMCFFPVFMSLMSGIDEVRSQSDEFLDMYDAPLGFKLRNIYLPLSLPSTFVGVKVATTMAVLGAIVAEFLGAYYGLGKNLYIAPKQANAELMMASAALTALMGMVLFRAVELASSRMLFWKRET